MFSTSSKINDFVNKNEVLHFNDALLMFNVVLFSLVSLNVYFVYYSLLKNLSFSFSVIATFPANLVETLNSRECSLSLSTSRQTIM